MFNSFHNFTYVAQFTLNWTLFFFSLPFLHSTVFNRIILDSFSSPSSLRMASTPNPTIWLATFLYYNLSDFPYPFAKYFWCRFSQNFHFAFNLSYPFFILNALTGSRILGPVETLKFSFICSSAVQLYVQISRAARQTQRCILFETLVNVCVKLQ